MTNKLPRLHMVQFILIIHVQVIPLEVDLWVAVSRDSIKWVKIQIISLSALLVNTELVIYNITRRSLIPAWYIATNLDYICSQSGLTTICPAIFISPSAARFFLRCASTHPTRGVGPMLFQCWPAVFDAGPTLKHHQVNASCAPGSVLHHYL